MNKPCFCQKIFLTDWRHKRLKIKIDLFVILQRTLLWIFAKSHVRVIFTEVTEAAAGGVFQKGVVKMLQISQKNTCIGVSGLQACNFIKKGLQHRYFFCEICNIFKNTYFEEHLRATACEVTVYKLLIKCSKIFHGKIHENLRKLH